MLPVPCRSQADSLDLPSLDCFQRLFQKLWAESGLRQLKSVCVFVCVWLNICDLDICVSVWEFTTSHLFLTLMLNVWPSCQSFVFGYDGFLWWLHVRMWFKMIIRVLFCTFRSSAWFLNVSRLHVEEYETLHMSGWDFFVLLSFFVCRLSTRHDCRKTAQISSSQQIKEDGLCKAGLWHSDQHCK